MLDACFWETGDDSRLYFARSLPITSPELMIDRYPSFPTVIIMYSFSSKKRHRPHPWPDSPPLPSQPESTPFDIASGADVAPFPRFESLTFIEGLA